MPSKSTETQNFTKVFYPTAILFVAVLFLLTSAVMTTVHYIEGELALRFIEDRYAGEYVTEEGFIHPLHPVILASITPKPGSDREVHPVILASITPQSETQREVHPVILESISPR
ncbi:MAG: hypothetical protein ACPGO5_04515 [Patescibacteria group bacterium]